MARFDIGTCVGTSLRRTGVGGLRRRWWKLREETEEEEEVEEEEGKRE